MTSTYNKGEWSELYVLVKILCEQTVTVRAKGDASKHIALQVLSAKRGTRDDAETFLIDSGEIVCVQTGKRVGRDEVCRHVQPLLRAIIAGTGQSFSLGLGEELLTRLGISKLKKGSHEKADVYLNVRDSLTGTTGWQGYTVKSLLGKTPTWFNAGETTNFEYRINPQVPDNLVMHYNTTKPNGKLLHNTRKTVSELLALGHTFTLVEIHGQFRENLELLDGEMPRYLDELLLAYYGYRAGKSQGIEEHIHLLAETNPLNVRNPKVRYQHKIKDFLEAVAYGMVPSQPYNGERTATGGLLVVEKSGDLTCFRLDDKDRTRDYLVEHAYLDRASRSRHKFGVLENHDGETRLKLNLQVRYK